MNRRRGRRGGGRGSRGGASSAATAAGLPPGIVVPASHGSDAYFVGGGNGYSGVDFSTDRGWVYWPQLDTRREITTYTRREILKKSRAFDANIGLAGHIIEGLAELIGFLTPLAMSADEEWNELSNESFRANQEVPEIFDAAGKFGFSEFQLQLDMAAFRDGDMLPVLTETNTGRARIAAYEAHQIANPQAEPDDVQGWRDGVRLNRFNRHLAYYLRDPDDASKGRIVQAQDAIYYGHWKKVGHHRPLSILFRALNHLQDIGEIVRDIKSGIKVRNLMPLSLETAIGGGSFTQGATSALVGQVMGGKGDGEKKGSPIDYEQVMTGGNIPKLAPGQSLKALIDGAPHPNQIGLLEWLVRDISWGCGVPPEILWDINTLRGANNRLLNSKLQRWIGARLLTKRKFVQRYWAYATAKEMKAGRLRECRDPQWWSKVAMLPQASMTADRGREGKLDIELVTNRMMSLQNYFAKDGLWWLDEIRQIAKERRECEELGVTVAEIMKAKAKPGEEEDPDEEEDDEDEPKGRRRAA